MSYIPNAELWSQLKTLLIMRESARDDPHLKQKIANLTEALKTPD